MHIGLTLPRLGGSTLISIIDNASSSHAAGLTGGGLKNAEDAIEAKISIDDVNDADTGPMCLMASEYNT